MESGCAVPMSNPARQPGPTAGRLTRWSSRFAAFIPLGKLHQTVCERPQVVTEHVDGPRHFRFDRFQAMAGCYDADRDRQKRIDIDRFPPVIPMRLTEVIVLPDRTEVPYVVFMDAMLERAATHNPRNRPVAARQVHPLFMVMAKLRNVM